MAVFQPGTACWGLYDQLVADRVLGWDELEPQLRDAIEANKTTDARKFVQYMFEPRDQKTYDLLIKDPMKWLTRQDRLPVGRNEKELVTIALARLARSDVSVADSICAANGPSPWPSPISPGCAASTRWPPR